MRRTFRVVPLVFLIGATLQMAHAQTELNVAIGFGAAQAKAGSSGIEGDPLSGNFFGACAVGSTATCAQTKALSSFMMGFHGDIMLSKYFGVGGEVTFQPGKQDYVIFPQSAIQSGGANLQSRTTFYDFDGIVQPLKTKRAALQVLGGIGGANLKFYASGSTTDAVLGTQNFSQFYGSSNHFQVHGGVGLNVYVRGGIYIRPQFDVHWVNNLNQFGTNVVKEESVWLGYNWGGH